MRNTSRGPSKKITNLRPTLDQIYTEFSRAERLDRDPLGMIDRSLSPEDFELVSFVVAGLSYGRVDQIRKSSADLLRRLQTLGCGPAGQNTAQLLRLAVQNPDDSLERALDGWKHRLNTQGDMVQLLLTLGHLYCRKETLKSLYQKSLAESPSVTLTNFCFNLLSYAPKTSAQNIPAQKWKGTGVAWFASSPADGGSCKRLLMWLRWMIRKDNVDPGTWNAPEWSQHLLCPVDTHIFQWARKQKITRRKSANWACVEEITAFFRQINPQDPVKYDFALCQLGMSSKIPG
ncbi:MAG: TIGR02757 family protein [Bdellovibrionales bacterium]|nr:TIGR02757 family protein [Bdellovibrionales bacterium]